jgi:hypothetical protein
MNGKNKDVMSFNGPIGSWKWSTRSKDEGQTMNVCWCWNWICTFIKHEMFETTQGIQLQQYLGNMK